LGTSQFRRHRTALQSSAFEGATHSVAPQQVAGRQSLSDLQVSLPTTTTVLGVVVGAGGVPEVGGLVEEGGLADAGGLVDAAGGVVSPPGGAVTVINGWGSGAGGGLHPTAITARLPARR
jgi:hypothetical protein